MDASRRDVALPRRRLRVGRGAMLSLLLTLAAWAAPPAPSRAAAPDLPSAVAESSWWTPNGPVTSIVPDGPRLFVGGSFDNWGPSTGHGVVVDATGARIDAARFEGTVTAVAPDDQGGWYVAGQFTTAGGVTRPNLAHLLADGTIDPRWTPTVMPAVGYEESGLYAIAVIGGHVLVGGLFGDVDGEPSDGLVALDPQTGERDPAFDPPALAYGVAAMVPDGGDVLVASPMSVQRLDAHSGAPDPAFTPLVTNAPIEAIALSGDRLYVGGDFGQAGGAARAGLAAIDALSGALDAQWTPVQGGEVTALLAAGGRVIVSGTAPLGGDNTRRTGSLDPVTGALDSTWCPGPSGRADALAAAGSRVIMVGDNTGFCGSTARNAIAVDLATGVPDPAWSVHADHAVVAVAQQGSRTFLGGDLASVGGRSDHGLVALDAATGRPDPSFDPDVHYAGVVARDGDALYVVDGQPDGLRHIVRISAVDGSRDPSFDIATDWSVAAMQMIAGRLWVVGALGSEPSDSSRGRGLAVIDPATSSVVPSMPSPPFLDGASTLAFDGTHVFVFGQDRTVEYDPASGVPVAGSEVQGFEVPSASQVVGDRIYVGHVAGATALDTASGAVDPLFAPAFNERPSYDQPWVSALTVRAGVAYVYDTDGLFALDARTGAPLDWSPHAYSVNGSRPLAADAGHLYFGGTAVLAHGEVHDQFAAYAFAPAQPIGVPPAGAPAVAAAAPAGQSATTAAAGHAAPAVAPSAHQRVAALAADVAARVARAVAKARRTLTRRTRTVPVSVKLPRAAQIRVIVTQHARRVGTAVLGAGRPRTVTLRLRVRRLRTSSGLTVTATARVDGVSVTARRPQR